MKGGRNATDTRTGVSGYGKHSPVHYSNFQFDILSSSSYWSACPRNRKVLLRKSMPSSLLRRQIESDDRMNWRIRIESEKRTSALNRQICNQNDTTMALIWILGRCTCLLFRHHSALTPSSAHNPRNTQKLPHCQTEMSFCKIIITVSNGTCVGEEC